MVPASDGRRSLEVLEERHMASIILYLEERGSSDMAGIYTISTNPRMPRKVAALESAGLVNVSAEGRAKRIRLTPKGIAVASRLRALDDALGGERRAEHTK